MGPFELLREKDWWGCHSINDGTPLFEAPLPFYNPPKAPCEDLRSGSDSESSQHSMSCASNSLNPRNGKAGATITLDSQLGVLKHKEVRRLVQGHTASEESQDLSPDGSRVSAVNPATIVLEEYPERKCHVNICRMNEQIEQTATVSLVGGDC